MVKIPKNLGTITTMKPKRSLSVVGLCFFLMVGFSGQVGAYDEDDLEKLKSTGDCSGCDLSEVFLQGADLSDANLNGAILFAADLSGANLTWADLTGANLSDANLYGANLTGANLAGANLVGAELRGANLTGADLTGTIFCYTKMLDGTKNNSGC